MQLVPVRLLPLQRTLAERSQLPDSGLADLLHQIADDIPVARHQRILLRLIDRLLLKGEERRVRLHRHFAGKHVEQLVPIIADELGQILRTALHRPRDSHRREKHFVNVVFRNRFRGHILRHLAELLQRLRPVAEPALELFVEHPLLRAVVRILVPSLVELLFEPVQCDLFRRALRLRFLRSKFQHLDEDIHRRLHRMAEPALQVGCALRIQSDILRDPRFVVVDWRRGLRNQLANLFAELVRLADVPGHLRVADRRPDQKHHRDHHGKAEYDEQHQIVFDKSIHSLFPSYFLTGSFSLRRISNEVRFSTSVSCSYLSRIEPSSSFEKYLDFLIFCCSSFSSRSRPLSTSV